MKSPLLSLLVILTGLHAVAQDRLQLGGLKKLSLNDYCESQGSWTASALQHEALIRKAIEEIINDPNCSALGKNLQPYLNQEQMSLNGNGTADESEDFDSTQSAFESLYGEANSSNLPQSLRPNMNSSLMNATLKTALFGLDTSSDVGRLVGLNQMVSMSSGALDGAIGLFDNMATTLHNASLPNQDLCLIKNPGAGALITSVVRFGAALTSGGHGVHGRLASSIGKLMDMFRNRDLTRALRNNAQADLWASISCLIESTTQSFCSALDAENLLDTVQKHGRFVGQSPFDDKKIEFNSPLAGYYILSVHLPAVASWIQEVLLSADPKWSTDGVLRASALDNVNVFLKSLWIARGTFRENINTMLKITQGNDDAALNARKNGLITALQNLVINLEPAHGSIGGGAQGTQINFFTQSYQAEQIPFVLIGWNLDKVPPEVLMASTGVKVQWYDWMKKNNFQNVPELSNPEKLAQTIEDQLKVLTRSALLKASNFYKDRIIFNKQNLINKTMISMTYSIKENLDYIYAYLENLEKMEMDPNLHGQVELVPSIRDTEFRIKQVLEAYEVLDGILKLDPNESNIGVLQDYMKRLNINGLDANVINGSDIIQAAYEKVVETVFDRFDVLLQRDGYLTTSLSTFVFADYVIKVKNNIGVNDYNRDLLITTGQNLINLLMQVHGKAPNTIGEDLAKAQTINKKNISAFEQVFRDTFVTALQEQSLIASGKNPTNGEMNKITFARLFRDVMSGNAFHDNPGTMSLTSLFTGWWASPAMMAVRKWLRPDLYQFQVTTVQDLRPRGDDSHLDFDKFRNIMCIQVLAFEDRKLFRDFCTIPNPNGGRQGIVLKSWQAVDPSRNEYLNVSWDQYTENGKIDRPVTDESICAFRDFNRRGLAYWLTQNLETIPKPDSILKNISASGTGSSRSTSPTGGQIGPAASAPTSLPSSPNSAYTGKSPNSNIPTDPVKSGPTNPSQLLPD